MSISVDEERDPEVSCRCCGKVIHRSASLAHAHSAHFIQWYNWVQSKVEFGTCLVNHVSLRWLEEKPGRQK